jgi:hypothetical protein
MLVPCSSCGRHVRAAEANCPFCASRATTRPAPSTAPRSRRATRAAVILAGVAALGEVGGCVLAYGGPGLLDGGVTDAPSGDDAAARDASAMNDANDGGSSHEDAGSGGGS